MKTMISSSGNKLSSSFDLRFGRAAWFCLLDEETGDTSFIENQQNEGSQGACSRVAKQVVELGAKRVISGDFGPRARTLLEKFNIQMVVLTDDNRTVNDVIKSIKKAR